jgi:zinc finger SWIM domain-containing protein 3
MREAIRHFLYDRCSIQEIEMKWMAFLEKEKITEDLWLYEMYELRELWCVAYHDGKCYLGLRSNQRSESLHSRIQFNLDRKMTLFELVRHFGNRLSQLRDTEARLDFEASSKPCLQPDGSVIEKVAAEVLTLSVFLRCAVQHKSCREVLLD